MKKSALPALALGALILFFSNCTTSRLVEGVQIGNIAPDIVSTDSTGNSVQLSSLRGKYVLLEFWSSTNAPARQNHSDLERLYEKYKNAEFRDGKGLTVFSVSIDTDKDSWIRAIESDRLTWPYQTCDFNGWYSKPMLDYHLNIVPKYYLINGDGVIISHNSLVTSIDKMISSELR